VEAVLLKRVERRTHDARELRVDASRRFCPASGHAAVGDFSVIGDFGDFDIL
jgi:hypothetical protein